MLVFTITECPSGVPAHGSPPYTMIYVTGSCSPGASLVAIPIVLSPLGTYGVIDPASPIGVIYAQRDQFEALCDNLLSIREHDVLLMIFFTVGEGGQLLIERITSEPAQQGELLQRLESKIDAIAARAAQIEQLLAHELPATRAALHELSSKVEHLIKHQPHHLQGGE